MSAKDPNRVDISRFKSSPVGTHVDSDEDQLEVKFYYSSMAWIFITFFGTTRMPYQIDFKCKETGEVFESVKDSRLIEHYMRFRRR